MKKHHKTSVKTEYDTLRQLEENVIKAQRELENFKKELEVKERFSKKIFALLNEHCLTPEAFLKISEETIFGKTVNKNEKSYSSDISEDDYI